VVNKRLTSTSRISWFYFSADWFVRPHLGSSRKIHVGQKIHGSLTLTDKSRYTPKARPPQNDPPFWDMVRKEGLGEWRAVDLYEYTQTLVEKFVNDGDSTVWKFLRQTATSGVSAQSFTIFCRTYIWLIRGWTASCV